MSNFRNGSAHEVRPCRLPDVSLERYAACAGSAPDRQRSWFDCSFEVADDSGRTVLVMPFDEVVPERHA